MTDQRRIRWRCFMDQIAMWSPKVRPMVDYFRAVQITI